MAACALATFANPYGIHIYAMGWQDFKLSPVNVTGWAQTPFNHLELFWITLVIFWMILVWHISRRKAPGWGFVAVGLVLSGLSMRYASLYPYFLIWSIPWMIALFDGKTIFFRNGKALPWVFVMMAVSIWDLKPAFGANPRVFPVDATHFLIANNLRIPFYHEYELGGYYLWALEDQPPVLIDGRYPHSVSVTNRSSWK